MNLSLNDLIVWLAQQQWSEFAVSLAQSFRRYGGLTPRQEAAARKMYDTCQQRREARAAAAAAAAVASPVAAPAPAVEWVREPGMYETEDGRVFRVKRSKDSGRLYASLYNPGAACRSDRFSFMAGAMRLLRATHRMTKERAMALGAQWSQCCVCGRDLTAAESVEKGIGPICIQRV